MLEHRFSAAEQPRGWSRADALTTPERRSNTAGEATVPPLSSLNKRMRRLFQQVDQLASAQATILIQGESGTGKEVIARALHQRSRRRRGPFVLVNCAGLPEGLLESELFGHERGAFTGATRQRPGKFELADGGTLFLDEIGAAELKVQTRLLRALQEKEFERVGGTQTLRVEVRVIAATNADLAACVRNGSFREDLFYRLHVVPLELPPLRDRREDIPQLVAYFAELAVQRNGLPTCTISADVIAMLQDCDWPGNVRQLENAVERMLVLARSSQITVGDIPAELSHGMSGVERIPEPRSFHEARSLFERNYLCKALEQHNGIISQVADAIGMSRKNLYTKLGHLNIDYDRFRR
jgi:DNA-binding NtrC family response regulator